MIYSNNTYDITAEISTYTRRDFKQVFDTTLSKWYMLNNLNEYEEYGIYGDSLSGTYYVGKLVVVNDEEYEWDGTQWNNLGPYVEVVSSVYRDASHTGYITFPLTSSDVASFEATFKLTQNLGAAFLIGIDANDNADWRIFSYQNLLYYDCGSGRWYASGYFNNQQHMRFDGNPMRIYNYDTLTYLYTNSYIRPIDKTMYFGRSDSYTPTSDYGYLYDLVFYSDNGETAIAHYIPYIQNGIAGLYDTMSNTFLAPTGVLGSESEQSIPKKYPTKSAPTIINVWPSKWYHNSTYMYKLLRNDAEQIIVAYMSDDKVRKGKYVAPPPPLLSVLYFEANAASTIKLYQRGGAWTTFEYSTDDQATWNNFTTSTSISLATGEKAYFRAKQTRDTQSSDSDITLFDIRGDVKAAGNIMMLYDYEHPENRTVTYNWAFKGIFGNYYTYSTCLGLTDVKDLMMPEVLSNQCCGNMFLGTRITSSPILPALTLVSKCYEGMFAGIPTLTDITMLATDISASGCLTSWLYNSPNTSAQTLYKNPNISRSAFSSGTSGIPSNWNVVDYQDE